MSALSRQLTAAGSESQRGQMIANAEERLAIQNPGIPTQVSVTHLGILLVAAAGLVVSIIMLRSKVFNRATAITGLLANGLMLGSLLSLLTLPLFYAPFVVISAPFRVTWLALIAIRLVKLAMGGSET